MKLVLALGSAAIVIGSIVAMAARGGTPAPKDAPRASGVVSLTVENYGRPETERTTIKIAMPGLDKTPFDVDGKASHIDLFADDKGTDLKGTATADGLLDQVGVSSDAGKPMPVLTFRAFRAPAPGAKELVIKGKAVINAITKERELRQTVQLKPGIQIMKAPVDLRIKDVQHLASGEHRTILVLESRSDKTSGVDLINSKRVHGEFRMLGADGKEIDAEQMEYDCQCDFDGKCVVTITYALVKPAKSITFSLQYVEKTEPYTFPLNLRVAVGL